MSEVTLNQRVTRVSPLQIAITILAVVTGLVHLDRGLGMGSMMRRPRGSYPGGTPGTATAAGAAGGGHMMMHSPIMALLPLPLPELFLLNFVGYIVLAAAYFLPALLQFQPLLRYQRVIRWLLIIYAAVTIVLWFLITGGGFNILAYIDKPIEVALIVLLVVDDRQASRQARLQRG